VELVFLGDIFRQNSYTNQQTHRALNPLPTVAQLDKKSESFAFLPYVGSIFNCISRVLSQHNIKFVSLPSRRVRVRLSF
jgi:hypothetical protein